MGANAGALASNEVPQHPGTGSAVLGFMQWCMAGVIAPLTGLGGDRTAIPMAVIIVVLTAPSLTAMALTRTPRRLSSSRSMRPPMPNPRWTSATPPKHFCESDR